MTVLLPASGYGKRNIEAPIKELMIREGRPLIEFTFLHLLEPGIIQRVKRIVIITRKEKMTGLTLWLENFSARNSFKIPVEFLIHEPRPSEEWPLTILASESKWSEKNLVLLPDTKLMLRDLIEVFDEKLDHFCTAWGTSKRNLGEVKSYGMMKEEAPGILSVTEKPENPTSSLAWGCFGFQKKSGLKLLKDLESSTQTHGTFRVPAPSTTIPLDLFEDLSR